MSANVKLGNDVIEGVETVQLENADAPGEYVQFGKITPSQKKSFRCRLLTEIKQ